MKKISKIFLISLTLLTFSNTASGGFFGDILKDIFGDFKKASTTERGGVNNVRCKVEYTQLDLATGLEKNVKHTGQYSMVNMVEGDELLYLMAQDLTDKINIWLNESPKNFITDLTIINCKERRLYVSKISFSNEQRWSKYKGCEDEHNIKLIDFLDRPKQWGYNVHKERLIKDYEDGCRNFTKEDVGGGYWDDSN
jgi:hypothetical protein